MRRRAELWEREVEPLEKLGEKLVLKMNKIDGSAWESDEDGSYITEEDEKVLFADDLEKSEDEFDETDGEWEPDNEYELDDSEGEYVFLEDPDDDSKGLDEGELEGLRADLHEMLSENRADRDEL